MHRVIFKAVKDFSEKTGNPLELVETELDKAIALDKALSSQQLSSFGTSPQKDEKPKSSSRRMTNSPALELKEEKPQPSARIVNHNHSSSHKKI